MPKEANINRYIFKKCLRLFWNYPKKIMLFPVIKKVWPYTLNGFVTLVQVCDAIDGLNKNKINGAIVEMGCCNGGLGALIAWRARKHNNDGRVAWLFDSFEGLPEFSEADREKAEKKGLVVRDGKSSNLQATGVFKAEMKKVHEISKKLGVDDLVRPIKGWFQNTVPETKRNIGPIALLYLDADIYESTKYCLDELYDLVVPGGIIILDDYETWIGSRQALYEFFSERKINPSIRYYPYGGRPYFIK